MMGTLHIQIILFMLLLPLVHFGHAIGSTSGSNLGVGKPKIQCLEAERQALLSIMEHLHNIKDGANDLLSSWRNDEGRKECCKWVGIRCDNNSGHVVWLDLSPSTIDASDRSLRGKISPSLLELRYLTHLDLSYIDFNGSQIPSTIGILSQLRYLNLSLTSFYGEIPLQLANLSHLRVLDLSYNDLMTTKNLEWLPHLSSLRYLDLTWVNLSRANNWIQIVNRLPSLTRLQLYHCNLPNISKNPPYLSFVNSSTSLAFLDLAWNDLSVSIYPWLFNFRNTLVHLDLSFNKLECSISQALSKMTSLTHLDLSHNNLNCSIKEALGKMSTALTYLALGSNKLKGPIPEALSEMTALKDLDLVQNMLEGEIPKSVWNMSTLQTFMVFSNNLSGHLPETTFKQLKHLEYLYLSENSFQGVISEAHFLGLSKLKGLDLSFNLLTLNISSEWNPPFQLDYIFLASCKLGPQFPKWLQTQKNYTYLDISNNEISYSIPNWFWDLSSNVVIMNLSNNQIYGEIKSSSLEFQFDFEIDLSSNQLGGSIPSFLFKGATLNLSQNGFSKLDFLCEINGDADLRFLDISHNKLFGELPDCWSHFKELQVLILSNNKLSGKVPSSIGSLTVVETLQLSNNHFIRELPSTLKNCTKLVTVDFGENKLSGPIPIWVGKSFPLLIVLRLRSNHFCGTIPSSLCHLSNLQVLDLSLNEITGSIPKCLSSFVALKERRKTGETRAITHKYISSQGSEAESLDYYDDILQLEWKGKPEEFKNNLGLVKSIDLSSNKLMGEIPKEMADLVELISLNLSRNNLSGHIPSKIGRLRSLEVLDLSRNHLVGQIPSSLAQVYCLSALNVSNNNLSGKIPTSTQLQSFPSAAYEGNPLLCGEPLRNKCQKDQEQTASRSITEEGDDQLLTRGFYITMALGFAISFWGVSGVLIFHKPFRCKSSFELLNDVGDFICITTTINKAKLLLSTIKS